MLMHYKKMGKGFPLIILHGLYGNSDNWYTVGKFLSQYFEVYIPDLRNHGHSFHSNIHDFPSMVEDLKFFFDYFHIKKAHLMGHSMGGKVAMLFSFVFQDLIDKLVVVDIAPRSYTSLRQPNDHILQHLNIIQAFASIDLSNKNSRLEVEEEFKAYVPDSKVRQFLLKNLIRNDDGTFRWLINVKALQENLPALMNNINITENSQINIPALFIKGDRSDYLKTEDFESINKIFPLVRFVTISNAGHWVHAEHQEEFIRVVLEFLN